MKLRKMIVRTFRVWLGKWRHYDRHIHDWDIDEFGKPYEVEGKNYGV